MRIAMILGREKNRLSNKCLRVQMNRKMKLSLPVPRTQDSELETTEVAAAVMFLTFPPLADALIMKMTNNEKQRSRTNVPARKSPACCTTSSWQLSRNATPQSTSPSWTSSELQRLLRSTNMVFRARRSRIQAGIDRAKRSAASTSLRANHSLPDKIFIGSLNKYLRFIDISVRSEGKSSSLWKWTENWKQQSEGHSGG